MPLVQLVVTLIVVGVLLWAINTDIPMDPKTVWESRATLREDRGEGRCSVCGFHWDAYFL
jgi:hypothetical protein